MKTLPCVGFELHYSPFERDCIENLIHKIKPLTLEFSFDTHQPVDVGQHLLILFSNQHSPTEKLYGEITDCIKINGETYRIKITSQAGQEIKHEDEIDIISMPVCKGLAAPSEITLQCPACEVITPFNLIANQVGEWKKGIMPIYNCHSCGTTRAMIGLLEYNYNIAKKY